MRDASGQVVAVLSVTAPTMRMRPPRPRALLPTVLDTAAKLSRALGANAGDTGTRADSGRKGQGASAGSSHETPDAAPALAASGQEIRADDTVLLHMATNDRLLGKPGYLHDFPGLAVESVHWLADRGIGMFGVEAVSPSPEGEPNFQAHLACGERGITHMECLANLDKLVGRGRFRFIGFPLKIRGGTASPIRAVAIFE